MLQLGPKWAALFARERETGMGYHVVSIILKDGRRFDRVNVVGGTISRVEGCVGVPFEEDDVEQVIVTHDRSASPTG